MSGFKKKQGKYIDNEMMNGIAGRGVWQGLRDIQRGRSGLRPVRPRAIRNIDGQMCMGPEETLQRWREDMERAALVLEEVTSEWGLTVSVSKTKLLVAGVNCEDTDLQPIYIRGGAIEAVTEFKYLGTIIEANGSIQREVEDRISKMSKVFGALKGPVFSDSDLSIATKRLLYRAVVLGVLLYGAETWPTKRENSRKLEVFHNRCLRSILGISTARQRTEHISNVQLGQMFGIGRLGIYTETSLAGSSSPDGSRPPAKEIVFWVATTAPPSTWA